MIKSVLCAVDISQPKTQSSVLECALQFADLNNAKLDVITVLPDFGMSVVGGFFSDDHTAKAMDGAKASLRDLVRQVVPDNSGLEIRQVVAMGNAYEEILKVAKATDSDLIVIGAHKPDFKDYLLGPNAARVVRHSDCSVYVVREK